MSAMSAEPGPMPRRETAMNAPARILVVDDEPDIREILIEFLTPRGHAVEAVGSAEAATERLAAGRYEAMILDLNLPGRDGLALLSEVRGLDPELCVLIITGYATADSAIVALRRGADDYLQKPFELESLALALDRALERRRLRRANRRLVTRLRAANKKLGRRGQELRERVAEATRNLRLLLDLARGLGRDLDLGETLDGVAERACALTHARRGLVLLRSPDGERYELEAAAPAESAAVPADLCFAIGEGLAGRAVLFGRTLDLASTSPGLAADDPLARFAPQSALAVPLVWEGTAIGILVLLDRLAEAGGETRAAADNAAGPGASSPPVIDFSAEEQDLAHAFAAHAAVAIRNAQIYEEARRLDRLQSEFIAAVSHELRTPLTKMKAALEILDTYYGPQLDASARELLSISDLAVRQLEDQIELILASAEMEGDIELDTVEVPAAELLEEAARRLVPVASRKGIRIEIKTPLAGALVRVDRQRFTRVLSNLLSNAVKFSESGEQVRLEIEAVDGVVRFHVIDRGVGIEPRDQVHIFRRFAQLDGSLTRRTGGTGLGLSVSRALVERHGGRITVASRPGQGSTFTVEVPAAGAATGEDSLASAA